MKESKRAPIQKVKKGTNMAIPPLQRLEHAMHPFVTFVVIPIFQ